MNNKAVAEYYDWAMPWYQIYHGASYGIHLGYHNKTTKTHIDEILNGNKILARAAHIKKGEVILDAGCGIGGSSIWLAKHYDVNVVGITISSKQLEKAKLLAKKFGVEDRVKFYLMDFTKTKFRNNTFDVVWGFESTCYADPRISFLKEAYRVLKKRGRLVIFDAFLKRHPNTKKEKEIFKRLCKGFRLPNNEVTLDSYKNDLVNVGFTRIQKRDMKKETFPSVLRIRKTCMIYYPIFYILEKLHLAKSLGRENAESGFAMYDAMKTDLENIFLFYGEK